MAGSASTQPYDMVVDVSKGDNKNEIKVLFGAWLTPAVLSGNKFTIQQTTFNGPLTTTGHGEFTGDKLIINYIQKAGGQTNTYSGTLTKF